MNFNTLIKALKKKSVNFLFPACFDAPDFIQFAFLVKDVLELIKERHYAGSDPTQRLHDVHP